MTTTCTRASMPEGRYTAHLIDLVQLAVIPAWLPAGVKITLLGDRERALRAAEEADLLAAGDVNWDQDYPETACEESPQDAAAGRALRLARDEYSSFSVTIAKATLAVTL
jgi:hypothetical protein